MGLQFSYLFCTGKLAVKHTPATPCYPRGVEMFLIAAATALLTVIIVDTGQKRRAFLCQQDRAAKRN